MPRPLLSRILSGIIALRKTEASLQKESPNGAFDEDSTPATSQALKQAGLRNLVEEE